MQISLWEEEANPPLEIQEVPLAETHCLIEVHYLGGKRRVLDTTNPEHARCFKDMSIIYAGFVESVEKSTTKHSTKR